MPKKSLIAHCLTGLMVVVAGLGLAPAPAASRPTLEIKTLSNRADLISGGDALVEIEAPSTAGLRVDVNGRDITSAFKPRRAMGGRIVGLVTGLRNGRNVLTARVAGGGARLTITNHPIGGPVFAGEQVQPWICTTEQNGLGPVKDTQCNTEPVYRFMYKPQVPVVPDAGFGLVNSPAFQAYDPESPPPSELIATTETDHGKTVPYIVRIERGVIDRGIYDIAVLFDPSKRWTGVAPQEGWNHKLLIPGGAGCDPGHRQIAPPAVLDDQALSQGFAVLGAALSNNTQNCNDVVQAEAVMMTKEHLIENYGTVRYSIGRGSSGGSMYQTSVAQNYPGILDGIQPGASFPDIWTTFQEMADCKLLSHYFLRTSPHLWAVEQQRAWASGHLGLGTCEFMAQARSDSYVAATGNGAGEGPGPCARNEWTYDPETNPKGVRCGLQDYQVATFGKRRSDGFGNRPYDTVGIQFGRAALDAGQITPEQFVDLNEKIGGLDIDGKVSPKRSVADRFAIETVYRTGRVNRGDELAKIPVVDLRTPNNFEEHYDFHSWQMKHRILRDAGHADNHLIWYNSPGGLAFDTIDEWLGAVEKDKSRASSASKVRRHRPRDAGDACWIGGQKMEDMGQCLQLFPYYTNPRAVAGEPRTGDLIKCHLKPLRRSDYNLGFTNAQWERLESAFSSGVCDYSKRSVGYRDPVGPWVTFKNGPGGRPMGPPPKSQPIAKCC